MKDFKENYGNKSPKMNIKMRGIGLESYGSRVNGRRWRVGGLEDDVRLPLHEVGQQEGEEENNNT